MTSQDQNSKFLIPYIAIKIPLPPTFRIPINSSHVPVENSDWTSLEFVTPLLVEVMSASLYGCSVPMPKEQSLETSPDL